MQTKFSQIPKIFSKEAENREIATGKIPRTRKIPAGATCQSCTPRAKYRLPYPEGKLCGCLPGRQQSRYRSKPRQLPEKTGCLPDNGVGLPGAGETHRTDRGSLRETDCSQNARRQPPESSPQPLPEATLPGFLVNKGPNMSFHGYLSAIQGEGL